MKDAKTEKEQFEQFYLKHRALLYRTAKKLSSPGEDPEDLMQDALLRILDHLPYYLQHSPEKIEALVVLTVQCQRIDNLRKAHRGRWADVADEVLIDTISQIGAQNSPRGSGSLKVEAGMLLDMLPPEDAFLLKAHHLAGYSAKELAALRGVNVGTINMRLQRARQRAVETWDLRLEDVLK